MIWSIDGPKAVLGNQGEAELVDGNQGEAELVEGRYEGLVCECLCCGCVWWGKYWNKSGSAVCGLTGKGILALLYAVAKLVYSQVQYNRAIF